MLHHLYAVGDDMKIETAKGVRDFGPEEKIIRNRLVQRIIAVFERYGFNPLETPSFERFEVLAAKFGAGEESDVLNEIFTFEDQGKRKLGLRFDLTLPLSRYIAQHPTLKMPFKRYEIGRVYRDGPIKLGRYREFWQCDVDTVGVKEMTADAELLFLALDVFDALGIKAIIEVNNRKLLSGILKSVGIEKHQESIMIVLDKLPKVGLAGVEKELFQKGVPKETTKKLTDIFDLRGSRKEILDQLKTMVTDKEGKEGIQELETLCELVKAKKDRIKLNISLARGLSYYTGTVFEGFFSDNTIKSAICGGGRYDTMIGKFASGREYPSVGISFGLEPITEFMKLSRGELPKTVTQVFVLPIKTLPQSMIVADELRSAGINTEIDLLNRGVSKNLSYVNAQGIPYVVFVGEEELKANKVKLRDAQTGKETLLAVGELVERLT